MISLLSFFRDGKAVVYSRRKMEEALRMKWFEIGKSITSLSSKQKSNAKTIDYSEVYCIM